MLLFMVVLRLVLVLVLVLSLDAKLHKTFILIVNTIRIHLKRVSTSVNRSVSYK